MLVLAAVPTTSVTMITDQNRRWRANWRRANSTSSFRLWKSRFIVGARENLPTSMQRAYQGLHRARHLDLPRISPERTARGAASASQARDLVYGTGTLPPAT